MPYKQAYGGSKPPVAYTRPLRAGDVALTGVAKITSEEQNNVFSDRSVLVILIGNLACEILVVIFLS